MCDMGLNLISTHILDKKGYGNNFGDGKWRLSRGSLVLTRESRELLIHQGSSRESRELLNKSC